MYDTEFEEWYERRFGVNPNDVLPNTPASTQAKLAVVVWEAAYMRGHKDGVYSVNKESYTDTDDWEKNPDRTGGRFTQQEIEDSGKWV